MYVKLVKCVVCKLLIEDPESDLCPACISKTLRVVAVYPEIKETEFPDEEIQIS
jgi:rRNA maturation endonuclease Nob1